MTYQTTVVAANGRGETFTFAIDDAARRKAINALTEAIAAGRPCSYGTAFRTSHAVCSCVVVAEAFGLPATIAQQKDPIKLYNFLDRQGIPATPIAWANDQAVPNWMEATSATSTGFEAARSLLENLEEVPE